jgi:HEAT repeat protein
VPKSYRLLAWLVAYSVIVLASGLLLLAWTAHSAEKSVEELGSELFDPDVEVRRQASRELFERGPEARGAIEDLILAFKDRDETVRLNAQQTVARIGKPAVPMLLASLKDTDAAFCKQSMFVLVQMGAEAVPGLVIGLAMDDPRIHNGAVTVLSQIGRPAVPSLRKALGTHGNAWVRHRAAMTLGLIGPEAQGAVPTLREALKDRSPDVRRASAKALGQIGKGSGAVVSALRLAQHDPDESVARAAGEALGRIGGEK